MEINVTKDNETTKVKLAGHIDEQGAEAMKAQLNNIDIKTCKTVILDLQDVNHIGSSGIGKILLFYKNLGVHGGQLRLEKVPPAIYELFKELKLDTLFSVTQ